MNCNPMQASGSRGQTQFNIVANEADQGIINAANISFEPGRKLPHYSCALPSLCSRDKPTTSTIPQEFVVGDCVVYLKGLAAPPRPLI
ncbi:MAG: hypothetical protein M2R45_01833 [Verrucomicrobia subdivision 3 bacterium]|nr:hypothetical protein [Limisphaerales bacterium]MCS1415633.1 hypothetical protein [Limisphaerales bacterium]